MAKQEVYYCHSVGSRDAGWSMGGVVVAADTGDDNEPETLLERVRGEEQRVEDEAIGRRIRANVEANEMTVEQARDLYQRVRGEGLSAGREGD